MLLVDHGHAEVVEGDVLLEQRVGAEQDVDLARREALQHRAPAGALVAPRQQRGRRPAASASGRSLS